MDGKECRVMGPSEIPPGEYLFVLYNLTDSHSNVSVGSYMEGGSYEDHFQWREENCGGQGTDCEEVAGKNISYAFATWYYAKIKANEGEETFYKVFDLTKEREHVIWAYSDWRFGWMCAPFQVTK
jgi:hypothetical protein